MPDPKTWIDDEIAAGRMTRRSFLDFCAGVAGVIGLPAYFVPRVAYAAEHGPRPTVIWLEFQDCCGNTESFLRASRPDVANVILERLSLDYHETLMAAAGHQAEAALEKATAADAPPYLVVIEGSIPKDGAYCSIGGKSAMDIAQRACEHATAVIAMGTCAAFGGLPAASPNPTGAMSVQQALPNAKVINLSACPANPENLVAVLMYYLTFGRLPPVDALGRPRFAYGKAIHDNCERRAHFDAGQYVEAFGDIAHRKGYCLYKLGCKGPVTYQNCPVVRWNDGTNWPIGCGHPCIGCSEPDFWDAMTPFYQHLPSAPGFQMATPIDQIGLVALGVTAAALGTHAVAKLVRDRVVHDETPAATDKKGGES